MNKKPKNRLKKRITYTLSIITLVLLGVFVVSAIGHRYADDILSRLVRNQTNGFYSLSFESLELDLIDRKILVRNLYLKADSARIARETNLSTIYEVELKELVIDLKSIYRFYLQKKLEIERIRIVDPEIRMQQGTSDNASFSLRAGNLYKVITDYLSVLKIDQFRIQGGNLAYNTDQFELGNIDFTVHNLQLDTIKRNDVFYSEAIVLEITNQRFILPDSIHEIKFDKFILSTTDSLLRFENLSIQPTPASGIKFTGDNAMNVYDIVIPSLNLKGVNYQSAYMNDHLIIDELHFEEPQVFVDDETHRKKEKRTNDNSIIRLLFQVFHKIDIGTLAVGNAKINLKINEQHTHQEIKSEEASLTFFNIRLDTSNYKFDSKTRYFDDLEINIKNYDYLIPDSVHKATFGSLIINSKDSLLSIDDLTITKRNRATSGITLQVPQLRLNGLNYSELINNRLAASRFQIDDMLLSVEKIGDDTLRTRSEFSASTIHRFLPYFNEVSIDNFHVERLGLSLPQNLTIDNAGIHLEGVKIDENAQSLKDFFTKSTLRLDGIRIDRDSIRISSREAILSHDLTEIDLMNLGIDIHLKQLDFEGSFDTLTISGIYPDSLMLGKWMSFSKAAIIAPHVNVISRASKKTKLSNLERFGIEKEIVIKRGNISAQLSDLMLSTDTIDADFYLGDSIAIHFMKAQTLTANSQKLNHQINLRQWRYDTLNDEMFFDQLSLAPINAGDTSNSQIKGIFPSISIQGFKQENLFDHNELIADHLIITSPIITGFIKTRPKTDSIETDFKIKLNHFHLESADLSLTDVSKQIEELIISNANASLFNVDYPASDEAFHAEIALLSLDSFKPKLRSGDDLRVGQMDFNSVNGRLKVDSISYKKTDHSLGVTIPHVETEGLNVKKILKEGIVETQSINVEQPYISIIKSPEKSPEKEINLPLSFSELYINDIAMTYVDSINHTSYALSDAAFTVIDYHTKGHISLQSLFDNAYDFTVEGMQLSAPLSDMYSFQSGHYRYNYRQNTFVLFDFELLPTLSKEGFSQTISTQKDWYDLKLETIQLHGIDLKKALSDSVIHVENVLLEGTDLFIYRDKHLPFPADQIGRLPQEQLNLLPVSLIVDTIRFKGRVAYEELPPDYEVAGIITFDDIDATLTNLNTMTSREDALMKLHATGKVVNDGFFDVDVLFELNNPYQRFSFGGYLRDFPLTSLNQMLGPVANINIKSGYADRIDFQFMANDTLAVGEMKFLYKDLKLQVLNAKKHETNLGSGIMSFFANTFVIRNKNPAFLFPREGVIYQKRDTSRAIFNYWGKSLLSGAVSSVGIHKSDREEKKFEKTLDRE